MKLYVLIFIFSCLFYMVFEVFFNAIVRLITNDPIQNKKKIAMFGDTSIWMFGFGGIVGIVLHTLLLIPFMTKITFLPLMIIIGAIIITALELVGGLLLNVKLKMDIWNYTTKINLFGKVIPLNYKGQIDVIHFALWGLMTFLIIYLDKFLIWLGD